jgi:DNA-binding CsgD family transcriptional regulator
MEEARATPTAGDPRPGILERERELERVEALIRLARLGHGRLAYVEGPAGLGKTALLAGAREGAVAARMVVVEARGSELERPLAFGVVRQLLGYAVWRDPHGARLHSGAAALAAPLFDPSAAAGEPESASTSSPWPILHGLYWLMANFCEERPLAVLVDDAHLADASSLRFLAFLAGRLTELPLFVAVAVRSGEGEAEGPLLAEVSSAAGVEIIRPEPLSPRAVEKLIEERLGQPPEGQFRDACHRATGGNPFYVGELLRDAAQRGLQPIAEEAARVRELGPPNIARALLFRLGSLPPAALPLVRACAVLGDGARFADCALLAEVGAKEAVIAADRLVKASVLSPGPRPAFVHPIVRTAIEADLGPHERAALHARAAVLLNDSGATAEQVALHLALTEPTSDAWTVETLRAAARAAFQTGAPVEAAGYLLRALAEPPTAEVAPDVLFELGSAEATVGVEPAIGHLARSVAATVEPRLRATRALALAQFEVWADRIPQAVATLGDALGALGEHDPELTLALEVTRYWAGRQDLRTYPNVAGQIGDLRLHANGPDSATRRELLVYLALEATNTETFPTACELMDRALAAPGLLAFHPAESVPVQSAAFALCCLGSLDAFDALYDEAMADLSRRGILLGFVTLSIFRCMALLRRGRPVDAEAEALGTLEAAVTAGWRFGSPALVAFLVDALLDQGREKAANAALEEHWEFSRELPTSFSANLLLDARGRLRVAQADPQAGLDDLMLCGKRVEALGIHCPGVIAWRSHAGLAHLALGQREAARRLAEEELALARRFAGPSAAGGALSVLGLALGGGEGIECLRQATEVLEASPTRLELARALVNLGAALRRSGQRIQAREHLQRGLEMATLAGAAALAATAHEELLATGARPRRVFVHGIDALTASERRVARMAAQGLANPEIAQALFITRKTVESHLASGYRKLGIASRADLAKTLEGVGSS